MNRPATMRQVAVLDAIKGYFADHGYSPTVREIGDLMGIGSLRGVTVHLDALEARGLIRRTPGVPRSIVVPSLTGKCDRCVLLPIKDGKDFLCDTNTTGSPRPTSERTSGFG